jgi:hydroxymethylpyrimidine/phosphomethylpyrimidine kinase
MRRHLFQHRQDAVPTSGPRPGASMANRDMRKAIRDNVHQIYQEYGECQAQLALALVRTPVALTIAGSDSGGGAGIQADLKAFAACGVHGTSAITAVTAQNTVAVELVHELPGDVVLAQVRAVLADIRVDAVKVGMLASVPIIAAVTEALDELPRGTPVVVDPVMVAESGGRLLASDAEQALLREIVPRASVLTPNLPEARALTGLDGAEPTELVRAVLALGPRAVVLTGGHRDQAVDLYLDDLGREPVRLEGTRHPDGAAHGSGCTHSAILAAQLALGRAPLEAARIARALAGDAVANGLRDVGAGAGPVDAVGLGAARAAGRPQRARLP